MRGSIACLNLLPSHRRPFHLSTGTIQRAMRSEHATCNPNAPSERAFDIQCSTFNVQRATCHDLPTFNLQFHRLAPCASHTRYPRDVAMQHRYGQPSCLTPLIPARLSPLSPRAPLASRLSPLSPRASRLAPLSPRASRLAPRAPLASRLAPRASRPSRLSPLAPLAPLASRLSPLSPRASRLSPLSPLSPLAPLASRPSRPSRLSPLASRLIHLLPLLH